MTRGRSVDAVTIAFGLRNVTRTLVALKEANRVLRRPATPSTLATRATAPRAAAPHGGVVRLSRERKAPCT